MKDIDDMFLSELKELKQQIDNRIFKLKQEKATAVELIFTLSMPNAGSWNGKWSGEGEEYTVKRKVKIEIAKDLINKRFSYNFGDGWVAGIKVTLANYKEKVTNKFCGYKWMVDSIIKNKKIITNKK